VVEQGSRKAHGHTPTRAALVALEVLLGLGAAGGGWAMLSGVIEFSPGWLRGSPFSTYAIPG
jgi:hypothetical protein